MSGGDCEIPKINATADEITRLLESVETIAVVGLSAKEERPSHWIAQYLRDNGYSVVGVHPVHNDVMGIPVYPSVSAVPGPVDLVNLFVRSDRVSPIVEEAIAKGAQAVWMQEGVINNAAADRARAAGLLVIMNKCIYKEHAAR